MFNMPKEPYYVFFDVDGTLIHIKSMLSFLKYFYKRHFNFLGTLRYFLYHQVTMFHEFVGTSREYLNRRYYQQYRGFSTEFVHNLGREWFQYEQSQTNPLFLSVVVDELINHQKLGATIVFVSGAFLPCLESLAKQLRVNHILSTQLEIINGKYTGKILPPQTIGSGKAEAIRTFLKEQNFHYPERCFAYGDHYSDIAMLAAVGYPHVIANDKRLEAYAKEKNWPILYAHKIQSH
jgi:HAD superfamily hydrolase (TIGR01490 family)